MAWQIYYLYRKNPGPHQWPGNLKYVCMYVWMYVCITGRPGPQSTAWHGLDTGTMW